MSDYQCYCEPPGDSGEYCDVWNATWRHARKEHKCCECGESIKIGERYEYTFTVYEGEASSHKTCEFCANEWKRLLDKHSPDLMQIAGELACALVWDIRGEA